ncbi:6-phospho-3-hexuloisomerase [Paenibacillus sp. D51F]
MQTVQYLAHIRNELNSVADVISDAEAEALISTLLHARRVYVAGAGRSGLMVRSFAMRLMHLGLEAYVVGETIAPGLAQGDLLLIATGSGETKSLIPMTQKAKSLQASVAAVTISPQSTIGKLADITVTMPGSPKEQQGNQTIQPMGSLFEQTLLLFFDAVVLRIMEIKSIDSQTMLSRHANLE